LLGRGRLRGDSLRVRQKLRWLTAPVRRRARHRASEGVQDARSR
jgi:hypothetical protein